MYGSDRCLYELVKRIDKTRFIPVIVLPFEGVLADRLRALGVTVYITDPWVLRKGVFRTLKLLPYMLMLPAVIFRLARIIRKEGITVVYSNTSVIVGAPLAAFLTRRPHICHMRELYDSYPGLAPFYRSFLCLFSRKIIAISNAVAAFVQKSCSNKTEVVYDGIALERFTGSTGKIPAGLSEWKKQNRTIVSNIGRVSPIKGQELFIDAAHECIKSDGNLRFLIIGSIFKGNEQFMQGLQDRAAAYGMQEMLTFTGFRNDVDDFMTGSDIIVVSTVITEGLGQVVMEGMAAGKVVIAPDKGGPVELIEDGTDGILYRAGNRDALAQAIIKTAGDPALRKSIGETAKSKAEKEFGIQGNIDTIQEVLRETANH
ncbi:MAG: glycosyltransferase [Deltaproteobacteria bacterium]|nr:glycosyltransferase [Deltaproteobacteria bacterium]